MSFGTVWGNEENLWFSRVVVLNLGLKPASQCPLTGEPTLYPLSGRLIPI